MAELDSKIAAAAATGLNIAETEAVLGHPMSSEERQEYNQTRALVKLKKKQEKQASIIPKPKRGTLTVQNQQNLQNLPSLSKRYTKKQIEDVIIRAHGLTSSICSALDCTTQQYYVWLRTRPDMKALQEECRLDLVNEAEEVIMNNLHDQDASIRQQAAQFVLNRLGRTKGWGEDRLFGITVSQDEQTKQINAIFGISQQ